MPTVTEGINRFLSAQAPSLPGGDLLKRFLDYGGAATLEVQVNAASDEGEPVEGRRSTWTDGNCTWFHIRVPKGANDKPEWNDYEQRWALEEHAEAIGSTGWDWKALRSRWVGYDFDDITGHARGVGISDDELKRVREAAQSLPYVEVRRSTGGKGLHLYVLFDDEGIPTANHTEHAAVARCILGMMTAEINFDFASAIDACGQNMWLWRRDITRANQGLELLKPATRCLSLEDLPVNWRDHVEVVTRRATKIKLQGVTDETRDIFDELTSAHRTIPLDSKHKDIIQALMETGFSTIWIADRHLLQAHTCALKKLIEDVEIQLIGCFNTISAGKNPSTPNCFMFPLKDGGWRVYRFSPGITEAETWIQDGSGWTTCYFNRLPDVETACRSNSGQRIEGKQQYAFPDGHSAIRAAEALGQKLDMDPALRDRPVELRVNNGYLTIYVKKARGEKKTPQGWIDKRGFWVRDLDKRLKPEDADDLAEVDYDGFLRSLRSPAGEIVGWAYHSQQGDWSDTHTGTVRLVLQGRGIAKPETEPIMGKCALNPWKLVSRPFQDEFPGGRQWNQNAPQLRYVPALLNDKSEAQHPHWDKILKHIGTELTPAVREHSWCRKHGIATGGDYLLLWIATIFKEPFERLPYLFLHGNEECGKSIFYEAIRLLMTKGTVCANRAISSTSDFNGELAGAVLCFIEEINVARHKVALPRIKDWSVSETVSIRKMRTNEYTQANTTHWVQVANFRQYCPIIHGKSRIVAIEVPDLLPGQDIPKPALLRVLAKEAPHFLYTLLNTELPPAICRLRIPIIETESKRNAINDVNDMDDLTVVGDIVAPNKTDTAGEKALKQFIEECCTPSNGALTNLTIFYNAFLDWMPEQDRENWPVTRVSQLLPGTGFKSNGERHVSNLLLQEKGSQP